MLYKLEDICTLITDGSHFSPEDEGIGYPMLSVKDMGDDDFDFGSCKHVGEAAYQKLVTNGCKPLVNDVVVAKDGSYLKTAFPITEDRDIALLSSIAILRPKISVVDPTYLSYYLKSKEVYRTVSLNYISGTALKRVILKGIKKIPIVLPDLHEQQFRADLLKKLNRIMRSRKQELQMLDDLIKARFVEMFGDPLDYSIVDKVELSELCEKITDGEHGSVARVPNGHPYLNAKHVLKNGRIDWDTITYVGDEDHRRIYKRCNPEEGDILLTTTGTIGNVAIMPKSEEVSMDRGITLLKIDRKKATSEFVAELLKQPSIQTEMGGNVHASAIGHLFMNKVKKLPAILPRLERQIEFTDFVKQVDKSKVAVQTALDKTQLLYDSLMQHYFG